MQRERDAQWPEATITLVLEDTSVITIIYLGNRSSRNSTILLGFRPFHLFVIDFDTNLFGFSYWLNKGYTDFIEVEISLIKVFSNFLLPFIFCFSLFIPFYLSASVSFLGSLLLVLVLSPSS